MATLHPDPSPLRGHVLIDLDVHEDRDRPGASFREAFRASVLAGLDLPTFAPVQCNVAESEAGTLRGIHGEPWAKYVHVARGEVFAAVVDLDPDSPTAGAVWTGVLDRTRAMYLSPGLGNAYQALDGGATYVYLVDAEWEPGATYPAVAWNDPEFGIAWPITDERLTLSAKDRANPTLREYWDQRGIG
jgi:dTDP-4-dehydrorhamnose 3,5-epimerase